MARPLRAKPEDRAGEAAESPRMDFAALRSAIRVLTIEEMDELAPLFERHARRAARLAERDDHLVLMAVGMPGGLNAIANALHVVLSRYASSTWLGDRDRARPRDPRHLYAHRVLKLSRGKVLEARTIREILAKKTGGNRQGGA